jgi:hypothetical protein
MRKSERLRLLELQVTRLEMMIDIYIQSLNNLLDSQGFEFTEQLESGKWYNAKSDKKDTD